MLTTMLIIAVGGALVGAWVGYKVGRATERIRPSKKKDEESDRRRLPGR